MRIFGTEETVHMESSAVPEILENSFFAQCITMISMILEILNDVHFIAFYIIVLLLKLVNLKGLKTGHFIMKARIYYTSVFIHSAQQENNSSAARAAERTKSSTNSRSLSTAGTYMQHNVHK